MNKNDIILDIMDLLEGNYLPESQVFRNVEKGLNSMNKTALSGLYSMLLTRVVVKKPLIT